jgi:nucleotide-binding universal stress UspA family protein
MGICDRIALAVDFSDASKIAARAAFEFARLAGGTRLTMIHAVRPVIFPEDSQPVVEERLRNLRERIRRAADEQLDRMCDELSAPAELVIDHRIVEGHPAEAIPRAAEEMQATLLLIGSHARKGVRRWLSGSISEATLHHVHMPTLVLLTGEDGVPPEAELADVQCMLIAVGRGDHAESTARQGFALARCLASKPKVILLHVVEPTGVETFAPDDPDLVAYDNLMGSQGRATLERLAAAHGGGVEVQMRVERGDADETIVDIANREGARILVVGTRADGLPHLLHLGSTATHVVRHSNVPVLVVPE